MRLARDQLVFLGLVALDEVVHHCMSEPYERTFALRATLAMLHALGDGDRKPFETFWRACAIPNGPRDEVFKSRDRRANELHGAYLAICRATVGAATITLGEDIAAARRDPGNHVRAYQAVHRIEDGIERARRLYAEALRESSKSRYPWVDRALALTAKRRE